MMVMIQYDDDLDQVTWTLSLDHSLAWSCRWRGHAIGPFAAVGLKDADQKGLAARKPTRSIRLQERSGN